MVLEKQAKMLDALAVQQSDEFINDDLMKILYSFL